MADWYVYLYTDPRRTPAEPIYVGIGRRARLYAHKRRAVNSQLKAKLNQILLAVLEPDIVKVFSNLSAEQAKTLERQEILRYGRLDLGTGPLCNRTAGGQGTLGYRHLEDTKLLFSAQRKGRRQTPAQLTANRARIHSAQAKIRIQQATKGHRWHTQEQLEAIRESNRTRQISDTTRKLWSAQRKGRKPTPEHVQKIRETKARLRTARTPEEQAHSNELRYAPQRGRKRSAETKAKMKAAWVLRKQRAADRKIA